MNSGALAPTASPIATPVATPSFFSVPLRSLLTASIVAATCGLGAAFVSVMLLFLGHVHAATGDLLVMQLIGLMIVAIPWGAYRFQRHFGGQLAAIRTQRISKWMVVSLIVTLGTAFSAQIALVIVAVALDREISFALYAPGLSILLFSLLWTDCYLGRVGLR